MSGETRDKCGARREPVNNWDEAAFCQLWPGHPGNHAQSTPWAENWPATPPEGVLTRVLIAEAEDAQRGPETEGLRDWSDDAIRAMRIGWEAESPVVVALCDEVLRLRALAHRGTA